MKVALITDGIYPYVIGGMQKHSYYLAKYLAQNQVYVDLYHFNQSGLDIDALEIFNADEKKYIHAFVIPFPGSAKFPGHYIYRSYKYASAVFEHIKDRLSDYDFIYTKGFSGWKLITQKHKGRIQCCPIGVKFHGYEMFQGAPDFKTKLQHLMFRPFVKKLSQRADIVFSYGGKITGLIKALGVDPGHILEIPSGIETRYIARAAAPANHPPRFIFLGRYERRKGIEELNTALTGLYQAGQNILFSFIGPIPEDKQLKFPGITYYGELRDFEKVQSILMQHDVLVCPSWSEGFPNVIMEAMASGLAVIATDVGAVSLLVNETNGRLILPHHPEQLKYAITDLLSSQQMDDMKRHSLQRIHEAFTWEKLALKLINAIHSYSKPKP